jgi:hypothetical protein
MAAAKTRLVHLAGLSERTRKTEQGIHDAAVARRKTIDGLLTTLRPRVNLESQAADQYQDLILERGQIETVIATAAQHLQDKSDPSSAPD